MKNLTLNLMLVLIVTGIISLSANANETKVKSVTKSTKTEASATLSKESSAEITTKVNQMFARLNEIKQMDIASMNAKEKKELRNEVRSIRKDLKSYSETSAYAKAVAEGGSTHGIYISTGALIIIILLLILLF